MSEIGKILRSMQDDIRALRAMIEKQARSPVEDPIVTREEAAKMLKVSERQLRYLVAAKRLMAHPSGFARTEIERYSRTPQPKLSRAVPKFQRRRSATEELEKINEMIGRQRRRKS